MVADRPARRGRAPARRAACLLAGVVLLAAGGCAVPQPRGEGRLERRTEPSTGRTYYLYLPKEYVQADEAGRAARRWPLVVTFHGMKPYDTAYSQAREWEQEADRYGYIVAAPVLRTFVFLFGEFPLRTVNKALQSDERATLAVLDHVFATTRADPANVLSTSWSSGGYIAHYMLNRHPDRFTCLAVRQSNFSAAVLDPALTARSAYHPVLILSTQNDVGICKRESREAIKWYEGHGYRNFAWIFINRLGHERTPDTAADFFARVCGVQPNRPPVVLSGRQAVDGNPAGLALLAGNMAQLQRPPDQAAGAPAADDVRVAVRGDPTPPRPVRPASPARPPAAATVTPGPVTPGAAAAQAPLSISLSSAVGFEPLLLVYAAECPSDWQRSASFQWTLNGQRIGQGVNGQKTILAPGDYTLEVVVVTRDGAEHRARRQIRVLKSMEASAGAPGRAGP